MKKNTLAFLTQIFCLLLSNVIYSQYLKVDGYYSNFGFSSSKLLFSTHTPIRLGAKIVAIDSHVFYIGTNNKICAYYWNGTTWTGGSQLEWSANSVQTNTQICNNGYEIFFC